LSEDIGRSTSELKRSLGGYRLHVRDATNAVGAKNFPLFSHGLIETLES
jgi:hypothetical protein